MRYIQTYKIAKGSSLGLNFQFFEYLSMDLSINFKKLEKTQT